MRNVVATLVVLGLLSACATVEPVHYPVVPLHKELPAIGKAELQDPAKIAERWGMLAELADRVYLSADLKTGRRFDWQLRGMLMRVQRIDQGRPGDPYYIQLNTATGRLEHLSNSGGQTVKLADWRLVGGNEIVITFINPQYPANRLVLQRDELQHYTPGLHSLRRASAADYAAVIEQHQQQVAAARAQERADKEAFWGNVAAGLAFATQVVAETSAEMAANQASTQALQASQASAAAARTAAAAAASSRAQQEAAARQAAQLAALNKTMEANRQAAQQNPNAAQAVAASKAASQQIAQAQRAAAAKADAAAREAQRQTQLAASANAAAQAQARNSTAIRTAALSSSGTDSAAARTVATAATSGKPAAGQYQIEGGTYLVTLHYDGANLVTTEPNGRVASYDPQSDQSYHYYNPKLDIVFGLRSLGDGVVEAFRPQEPGVRPDRLILISESTAAPEPDDEQLQLAEKYRALSRSDPANAQSWVACAAVAMKRSVSGGADSERYSRQMAQMLKQIAVDKNRNPCPEVITNW